MARTKKPQPEQFELVATIEKVEHSYYISEYRHLDAPAGDEAIIELTGRIEQISPRHKKHLGKPIEMSLACERSFDREERKPPSGHPFLLNLNLRKDCCSLMAYLPADALWELPKMIDRGAITHLEARFGESWRGSADLLSLHFASLPKLREIEEALAGKQVSRADAGRNRSPWPSPHYGVQHGSGCRSE